MSKNHKENLSDFQKQKTEDIQPLSGSNLDSYMIFHIEGGLGKHIAATAVVRGLKTKYPDRKLIVVAAWPEPFLFNPFVYRVYRLGVTPYFYDDYITGKDTLVFKNDPYNTTEHIHQKQHVIQSWFQTFGLDYTGELPDIFTTYRIVEMTVEKWRRDRPIMIMQTNGGPYNNQNDYNPANIKSWSRDIPRPIAEKLVYQYQNQYHIFQICKNKANAIPGTEAVIDPTYNLELLTLLRLSEKRLLIDSCMQHAAAAFRLPSTVLWNGTRKEVFGYDIHDNIMPNVNWMPGFKNPGAYLYDFELWGDPLQCPFDTNEIYNVEQIIQSIDAQKNQP